MGSWELELGANAEVWLGQPSSRRMAERLGGLHLRGAGRK